MSKDDPDTRSSVEKKPRFTGFRGPTTTPVPDEVFDDLLPDLTGAEVKVLLYICRRTFGFKKDSDSISLSQMTGGIVTKNGQVVDRGTGLSKDSVTRALKTLEEKGVIVRRRKRSLRKGDEPTAYSLNFIPVSENRTPRGREIGHPVVEKSDTQQHSIQQTDVQQQSRRERSNNSGGDAEPPPADVVATLREIGLSEKVAQRLAQRYNRERILEKIEYLAFLQKGQPKKVTNPRGWLRRAIEEDYAPPDGYKPEAERQEKTRELAQAQAELEKEYEQVRTQREQERAAALAELKETYGTTQKELDLWAQALAEIEVSTTPPNFQAWFIQTQLLSLKDGVAVIGAPNQHTREWLEHRLHTVIQRVLDRLVGHPVTLTFVVLESQEGNGLKQQHRVQPSDTTSD